jgi:hypothetical protein
MSRTARCLCGLLSARVEGEPLAVNICHCLDCRRRTGAAFSYSAYFDQASVQIDGPSECYAREGQDGRKVRHHFCPSCGTTVYWDFDMRPDRYGIAAALFDDPAFPRPSYSFWEQQRRDWVVLPVGVEHFQGNPVAPAVGIPPAQKS